MKQPVVIRVFKNGQVESVKQFQEGQIVIGTNNNNQIILPDDQVSAIHAVIEERDNGYYICDLGSETGTFHNGEKVFDQQIQSGQKFNIGTYEIEFFVGVPKPQAAPEPPAAPPKNSMLGEPTKVATSQPKATPPPVAKSEAPASVPQAPKVETPAPKAQAPTPSASVAPPVLNDENISKKEVSVKFEETDELSQPKESTKSAVPDAGAKGYFAPPSEITDLGRHLKPGKGPIVEVIVAWKERVIGTYHFKDEGEIKIGSSDKCQIPIPLLGVSRAEHTLLKMGSFASVCFTPEMAGYAVKGNVTSPIADLQKKNRIRRGMSGFEMDLEQEEMICLSMYGEVLNVYIRYTNDAPKPALAPFMDMSASEVTGVVLSVVLGVVFSLYMMIYSPSKLEDQENQEEKLRMAKVVFKMPKRQRPKKKKVVKVTEQKQKVKAKKTQKKAEKKQATTRNPDPGKMAALKKMKDRKQTNKKTTIIKKGGGVKLSANKGSNMKMPKQKTAKDVGLLSAFGKGGAQKKLNQAYDGAGGLLGMAENATGYSGSSDTRAGESFGGNMKASGAGGRGRALVGGGGVNTSGRGTGNWGSGSGGIGKKGNVDINVSGEEVEVEGFIDKEAIRRVIRRNRRAIQLCYERQLNRKKDLYGKIKIAWTIVEEGRVGSARAVQNTLQGREGNAVASCIINKLRGWKFPEPPQDQVAEVEYPFIFSSQ